MRVSSPRNHRVPAARDKGNLSGDSTGCRLRGSPTCSRGGEVGEWPGGGSSFTERAPGRPVVFCLLRVARGPFWFRRAASCNQRHTADASLSHFMSPGINANLASLHRPPRDCPCRADVSTRAHGHSSPSVSLLCFKYLTQRIQCYGKSGLKPRHFGPKKQFCLFMFNFPYF